MDLLSLPDELLARIVTLIFGEGKKIALFRDEASQRAQQYARLSLTNKKLNGLATEWLLSQEICVSMDNLDLYCNLSGHTTVQQYRTTEFILQKAQHICADFFPSYRLSGYASASQRLSAWNTAEFGRIVRFSIPPDYKTLPELVPSEAWKSFCESLLPTGTPISYKFDFSGPDYSDSTNSPVLWRAIEDRNQDLVLSIIRLAPETRVAPSGVQHLALHALEYSTAENMSAILDLQGYKGDDGFQQLLTSVLLLAALQGKDEMVKVLVGRGADVHGLGPPATPMFCAMTRGNESTVGLLKRLGAKV